MQEQAARAACLILKHLQQVPQRDPTTHNMLVFFCSSHIHEPQFWEAIISPIRNALLKKDGPCELIALEHLKEKQHSKRHVAFRDCIKDYAALSEC